MLNPPLLPPAKYFPAKKGVYEVTPGLSRLGSPMGNGERDGFAIQLDDTFEKYRVNKARCRSERFEKYCATHAFEPAVRRAVNEFLIGRFCQDYPQYFSWNPSARALDCAVTGETLLFDPEFELLSETRSELEYRSAWDALACQIQEDVAVTRVMPDGENVLSALHLCSPSYWAAEEKIGKNFVEIHRPVPGIDPIIKSSKGLVDLVIKNAPYSRFVWMFVSDDRLNHHPVAPPGEDPSTWRGRTFDRNKVGGSPFFLRFERQVLCGLPAVQSFVFFIRTYFIDGEEIRRNPEQRGALRSALLSMKPESRVYKGLHESMDDVVAWLDEGASLQT